MNIRPAKLRFRGSPNKVRRSPRPPKTSEQRTRKPAKVDESIGKNAFK
jgi:hypothetical protein